MKVAVFIGTGAVLAGDVSRALTILGIPHSSVDEFDIEEGALKDYSILIVPGGITKVCLRSLSKRARESIVSFVKEGLHYIGICMGAYVASELGLVKSKLHRGKGEYVTRISLRPHEITRGFGESVDIQYQNGPKIEPARGEEVIAAYDDGRAAIISSKHGKGKVILFSPHPERLPETRRLLANAIEYCLKGC